MNKSFGTSSPKILKYVAKTFKPMDPILNEVRRRSVRSGLPQIHVGEMDGLHLEVLTRAFGASRAVEIGTLAGYSGICIARGLSPGGKLYTFEFDPMHAKVAQESFKRAKVSKSVELFVGPALENLRLIEQKGPFDLVFIDADKFNYPHYLDWAWKNLRKGGAVLGDNTLAWGMIANSRFSDRDEGIRVKGLQKFNRKAASESKWRSTLIPTGEGLTLAVKV